jgi:hypothetical protein
MACDQLELLQGQLDELRRKRASGVRMVTHNGKSVQFASDREIAAAISDLERRIADLQAPAPRIIRVIPTKGL